MVPRRSGPDPLESDPVGPSGPSSSDPVLAADFVPMPRFRQTVFFPEVDLLLSPRLLTLVVVNLRRRRNVGATELLRLVLPSFTHCESPLP